MEHHSNIVPWHFIRERQGAKLVWVPVDDLGVFHIEEFEKRLTSRTKLVAITQMSNALGTVTPIKQIVEIAHAKNIPVLVDGSQSAVHMPIDVQDLGCDFFVFTGHKVYGPSGIGVLYGKTEMLERMRPFMGGGEMIEEVTEENVTYNDPPHRFEAGTPPIVQAIGLGAALEYMEKIGRDRIAAHEADLKDYAHERLRSINSLRIFGDAPGKGAIVSFELQGIHAHDVSMVIDRQGVAVRAGTHCAQPLLKRFGVTSTCRASSACIIRAPRWTRWSRRWKKRESSSGEHHGRRKSDDRNRNDRRRRLRSAAKQLRLHASAIPADELARITDDIVSALKTVYDPEIPADIYELGLIYKIDIEDDRTVKIKMTLTAPGCPVAGEMPGWVQNAVGAVEGVSDVEVDMVFDPPWTPDRMSEEAQVAVGWY